MSNHNKIYVFFTALLISNFSLARIHDFETTHLKSTGGAGVGSILLEESAFLNPASISFYGLSSAYFQKDSLKTTDNQNGSYADKSNYGVVLAQGTPNMSGTFSYTNQKEDNETRKRFGISLSGPVGKGSAMGFSTRKSTDLNTSTNKTTEYYQTVFGVTHYINDQVTLGVVAYDPFKSKAHETKAMVGLQAGLLEYISAVIDIGADYTSSEISKKTIVKGGLQVKLLDDFYLRFGGFNDKIKSERGEGMGIAWIQPKLAFELALKNTRYTENALDIKKKDISFSISLRGF